MTEGVTKSWVQARAAKATAPVREGWADGALVVFVPGRPRNPLNNSHGHWTKHAKWAKDWRERAGTRIWAAICGHEPRAGWSGGWTFYPADPKRITFTVYGPARFDSDNLQAVVKPVRDALKDMAVIQDDRPQAGHTFVYVQAPPSRKGVHGIAVKVERA